jgi:peptide/nickel transport system substrate-binding protein
VPHLTRRALLLGAAAFAAAPALACRTPSRDRLVVALGADPAGLHPLLQTGLLEASVYSNVYDGLLALGADGKPRPALAESWTARDERSWSFKLRDGVKFHDGEPFTSESVRFTVGQLLDPATGSPIKAQLDAIERVETPNARTAVIVTKEPFAPLLAELSGLMMLPPGYAARSGLDGVADKPIGTGPFRFVERVRDDHITLEANPSHWRGAPAVGRVDFKPIGDPLVRWTTVRTGDVQLASAVPPEQAAPLAESGVRVASRPGVQTLYVRLNARKPPLDDPRVRRAIAHSIDLDQLIRTVYGDRARRVNGPYPPEVFGYDADAPLQRYDPALARELLREAGVGEDAALIFETPRGRYPKDEQLTQLIASYLADAGLKVKVQVLEWATYLTKVTSGRGEHMFLLAGTNRTFDPHFTIARIYANASTMGSAYYGNPEVDRLAVVGAATLDPQARRAVYRQILALLRRDQPALWLAQLDDLYAVQPGVRFEPRADGLLWLGNARLG